MHRNNKSLILNAFFAGALLAGALALPLHAEAADQPRVITVTGEASVTALPDLARISIGVSEQATSAQEALRAMSAGTAAVLARLEAAGIAATDMQTGQLSLEPQYDYSGYSGAPKMNGFVASTMIEVRVRDLALLGEVLDAVVADGANRLGGVSFDLAERRPALDAARRDAVAVARARAELFAQAAGVELGALMSLSENGGYSAPLPMFARGEMMDAASVPVAAGEVALQASVTLVYAIAD
ncbi:MAG: SIMPL domain-containing protein [Rhodobacterales bacterium]|nr:SIMPL domain-containing protein [Rhodobacterales bacterium]NCT11804.1 SIMPL domain-containing protein [Rhodobacterales bacterium]